MRSTATLNSQTFLADKEEPDFRIWLESAQPGQRPDFQDELFSRCADAVEGLVGARSTRRDVAILVRHAIRRMSERDGIDRSLVVPATDLWPEVDEWRAVSVDALPQDGRFSLRAKPWCPDWLWSQDDPPVDAAAVAGTHKGSRALAQSVDLPADPFFTELYQQYKTPGQKAAVRAALTIPENGALLAILPTGTGKTEVALALAKTAHRQTTVIVIPTITLAWDFEHRFRGIYNTPDEPFAWTGETSDEDREKLRDRFVQGRQPILVITPDSLEQQLRDTIRDAAGAGRIRALVIDEAHLFTQWGRSFKPQYRELAALRKDILDQAKNVDQPGFRTVLLSATVGAAELRDLHFHFSSPGPFSVVAANSFRREHDYWVSERKEPEERKNRVKQAVLHLPRPLLLYVTRPADANQWKDILQNELGLQRVGIVHGQTPGEDRLEVLEAIRAGGDATSRFDVVVGSSAFGLGIDYGGFRSVIHACIPETIDRWYQEVGRIGRDGDAATALLIPSVSSDPFEDDAALAHHHRLTPLWDRAFPRWENLWAESPSGARTRLNDRNYVNVDTPPPDRGAGEKNVGHNSQLLYGLEEIGAVRRRSVSWQEAQELGLESKKSDWIDVELTHARALERSFFEPAWEKWRTPIVVESARQFETMMSLFNGPANVCETVFRNYSPPTDLGLDLSLRYFAPSPPCGRCPFCRKEGKVNPGLPLPTPPNSWIPGSTTTPVLDRILRKCRTDREKSLSLFVYEEEFELTERDGIADLALRAGVRWFVGCEPTGPSGQGEPYFVDDESDVDLSTQLPVPSLLVFDDVTRVQKWIRDYHPPYLFEESVERPAVILVSRKWWDRDDAMVALRVRRLKRFLEERLF